MNVIQKPIDEILPYANNPRKNDEAAEKVAASIKEYGFINPIIVDKNMVIVAGHTRLKAAQKLGMKTVPVIIADKLTAAQAKAYRLVDNKVSEIAEWDEEMLAKELQDIRKMLEDTDDEISLEEYGFTMDDFGLGENSEDMQLNHDANGSLQEKFLVPPFTILDTRKGYWQERKRAWQAKIQDDGKTRGDAKVFAENLGINTVSVLDATMAEVVTNWFTPKAEVGANCFDVFAGDSVFGFVSSYLGKNFTGIELRPEQANFNNERVKAYNLPAKYICDDGRNVLKYIKPKSQDLLFSCPPYYDLEQYSDLPNDASNQETYEEFYAILDKAFTDAIKCLKDDRFAVIVVGDIRNHKDGAYYRFPDDIKDTFTRNGMILYNELILINVVGSASMRANKYMENRKMAKVHQNVLVFYKGDTKKIKENFGECDVAEFEMDSEEEYESEDV